MVASDARCGLGPVVRRCPGPVDRGRRVPWSEVVRALWTDGRGSRLSSVPVGGSLSRPTPSRLDDRARWPCRPVQARPSDPLPTVGQLVASYAAGARCWRGGRLAMKSPTSRLPPRTARAPPQIGFGERRLGHQRVEGRARQRGHGRHVAERKQSRRHVSPLCLRPAVQAIPTWFLRRP